MRCSLLRHLTLCVNMVAFVACTQSYKPKSILNRSRPVAPEGKGAVPTTDPGKAQTVALPPTEKPVSLIISNTKLAVMGGSFSAKISYATQTATQDFTVTGAQTELSVATLPAGTAELMTIEFYQAQSLKFVAKRAKVTLAKTGSNNIIIDDCLILPAPWPGLANEGSCEWTITEVTN